MNTIFFGPIAILYAIFYVIVLQMMNRYIVSPSSERHLWQNNSKVAHLTWGSVISWTILEHSPLKMYPKKRSVAASTLYVLRLAPEWHSLLSSPPRRHRPWHLGWASEWVRTATSIGRTSRSGLELESGWARPYERDGRCAVVGRGRAHRDTRGPTPLGPAGTPLVPALTHSTSGAVTGSNARLGTSKDLTSVAHETPSRRFGSDDNTLTRGYPSDKCSDYRRVTLAPGTPKRGSPRLGRDREERSQRRSPS